LRGRQEAARRDHQRLPGADARAAQGARPRHGLRHPARRLAPRPRAGRRDHGEGARRHEHGLPQGAPEGPGMSRKRRPDGPEGSGDNVEGQAPEVSALLPDSWRVHLPIFEGPLDLLLHLIKINKVEITDIPVATICDQFHAYLQPMEALNLDAAGEGIYEAGPLIPPKSKMPLPPP